MKLSHSLTRRVALGLAGLVLVTAASLWATTTYLFTSALVTDRKAQAAQRFRHRIESFDRVLSSYERTVEELARAGELLIGVHAETRDAVASGIVPLLTERVLVASSEEFAEVASGGLWFDAGVLGAHNQAIGYEARLTPSKPAFEAAKLSPFGELRSLIEQEQGVVWSKPYRDSESQKALLTLGAPVQTHDGRIIGLATLSIDSAQLSYLLRELDTTGTSQTFIIDPLRSVFVSVAGRGDLALKEVEAVAWGSFASTLSDSSEPTPRELPTGTRWFHRGTLKNGLIFGMSVPEQEALARVTSTRNSMLSRTALVTAFVLLLVVPIAAIALRPFWAPQLVRDVDRRNTRPAQSTLGSALDDPARRSRARFIEAVNHEIREPVASILSTAVSTSESVGLSGAPPGVSSVFEFLQERSVAILSVLDDLLDLAAIEDGTFVLGREVFSLREVLDRCLETVRIQADKKRIVLLCEVDRGVPDELVGDPSKIGHVLVHIVRNAVRYTPDSGGVMVLVTAATRPSGRLELQFSVADSGVGISQSRMRKLFKAYLDSNQPDSAVDAEGSGLGLTVASSLVEQMGGEIRVSSREGIGTTFRYSVVVGVRAGRSEKAPKVLLVDGGWRDEMLPSLLLQAGVPFCVASDPVELREVLTKETLRLVIMDVPVDHGMGMELLSAIHNPEGLHRLVPVVGFKDRRDNKPAALDSVVSGWVERPADWSSASQVIERFGVSDSGDESSTEDALEE